MKFDGPRITYPAVNRMIQAEAAERAGLVGHTEVAGTVSIPANTLKEGATIVLRASGCFTEKLPFQLAFLIPAYNEGKVIRRTILSAYAAGARGHVYVIDDGSADNTAEVAWHFGAQVLRVPNGGKANALEAGIQHFDLANRYTHIAVLDADSLVEPGYVKAIERAVAYYPRAVLFCGRQVSQRGPWNWLTSYRAVEYAVWCGVYREAQHVMGTINVAPGFASTYEARTLAGLDFHGGTVVEDMDMTMQLQRRGAEIVYVPGAIVATQDPRTLRDFKGQVMRWYRGTWQVIRKHRLGRGGQRVDIETGILVGEHLIMTLMLLALPYWLWAHPTVTLLALAADQIISFTFTVMAAIRERRPELVVMFPTYVIPRLMGYVLFTWAFLLERRTTETKWFSVNRY